MEIYVMTKMKRAVEPILESIQGEYQKDVLLFLKIELMNGEKFTPLLQGQLQK
jgi:hypothetical protein